MTEDEFKSKDDRGLKPFAQRLEEVLAVAVDPGNAHANDYLHGMANGLILADAMFKGVEPKYIEGDAVFNYAREAEKTNSIIFTPEHIGLDDFIMTLRSVIVTAERMNLFKKLFFRGKTPKDIGMVAPEYQRSVGPLFEKLSNDDINVIHGIIGVITEAGEMAELMMAFMHGHPFDRVNALEESGDVEWYQHRILAGIGATADLRDRTNIDKLHGRHGSAFDVFRDANRDLSAERGKLEASAAPLLETMAGASDPAAVPPRERNQPPLPPGVEATSVGSVKTNIGDVEGMDC